MCVGGGGVEKRKIHESQPISAVYHEPVNEEATSCTTHAKGFPHPPTIC